MTFPLFPDLAPKPVIGPLPPVSARSDRAREAGESGREAAAPTFGAKQRKILLWLQRGPMSRQQVSEATGISINAVCSCLDALIKAGAVASNGDHEHADFNGRQTKRERFRVVTR